MKVLVTGGAGFIGSNIVDVLIGQGHEVAIIDYLSTGKREFINPDAHFYELDIRDEKVTNVFREFKPEIVIHHAAQIDVQQSIKHPKLDADINIIGTISILENCQKHEVKKIIYASSAAVYGNPVYLSVDEKHTTAPISNYGVSKFVPELYIKTFSNFYNLDFSILRYANVYGIRQDPKGEGGVISIFIDKFIKRKEPVIFGDGGQTRDFIYVKDIVQANIAAMNKGSRGTFNISCNTQTSVNELVGILNQVSRNSIKAQYKEPRKGDIIHSYLNNQLAIEQLGWEPHYSLLDGLIETYEYYAERKNH